MMRHTSPVNFIKVHFIYSTSNILSELHLIKVGQKPDFMMSDAIFYDETHFFNKFH